MKLDAGAFSNREVIKAAKNLVLVLLDCSQKGRYADLKKRARVTGYPTVIFCDPKGSIVGKLRGRSPADVARQFKDLEKRYSRRP